MDKVIWHQGSLALLAGAAASLALMLYAAPFAVRVLLRWDLQSSGEEQFALEKTTSLISALAGCAIAIELASFFLFVATADDFRHSLVGAMCATGALNASPLGWYGLGVKFLIFFAGSAWLMLNGVDNACPDYPLVRIKYALLLALIPLFAADLVLLALYLEGLRPDVITSCCGSLFSTVTGSSTVDAVNLPPQEVMRVFNLSTAGFFGIGLCALAAKNRFIYLVNGIYALYYLGLSLVSTLVFIAPHIYQLPTHHCPFDIFQGEYYYIGYPYFLSMFAAALLAFMAGVVQLFKNKASLGEVAAKKAKNYTIGSLCAGGLFASMVYYYVYLTGITFY